MEFNRNELLSILKKVVPLAGGKSSLPILSHVLLGEKSVVGTDLDISLGVEWSVPNAELKKGMALPAKKLMDIVSLANVETIEITQESSEKVKIRAGKSRYNLSVQDSRDYPAFPKLENREVVIRIPSMATFINQIKEIDYAIAQNDAREYLNGLLIHLHEGSLKLVASDGHRLGVLRTGIEIPAELNKQLIIPLASVKQLRRIFDKLDETGELTYSGKLVQISAGGNVFQTKMIVASFGEYQRVMNVETPFQWEINSEELRSAVTRVAVLNEQPTDSLVFSFADLGELKISTQQDNKNSSGQETLNCEGEKQMQIGLNTKYLKEVLGIVKSESLILRTVSETTALFFDQGNPDLVSIVMPVRL